jgi:hypothetical protein
VDVQVARRGPRDKVAPSRPARLADALVVYAANGQTGAVQSLGGHRERAVRIFHQVVSLGVAYKLGLYVVLAGCCCVACVCVAVIAAWLCMRDQMY